ncbi:MAG: RNA polymerase factor sigma-54 [Gammaproteobacteria bacterium]|nr:RNA polymerase factor sigma-54 [Gammaproteobacteria bacterium]
MKQTLQLKLGQQLTMTPQLQQAIRLLQLSSLELSLEIQQALDSNMMLELEDEEDHFEAPDLVAPEYSVAEYEAEESDFGGDDWESSAPSTTEDIPEELPVDSDWEDLFDSTLPQGAPANPNDDDASFETASAHQESLQEHLLWQVNLLPMTELDRRIAHAVIDAINDAGYLEIDIDEIKDVVVRDTQEAVLIEEVVAVLKQIQALDPAGVGARNPQECLLLQLRQFAVETAWREEAIRVCEDYLELLAARDYPQLMRRLKLSQEELRQVITLVQSLNPRPGSTFGDSKTEYLVPDVFVRKVKSRWKVELNPQTIPQVRINPYYASMIRRAENGAANNSLRTHLQEAKWFIKSLQSRSETLLRVATAIVERQRAFLDHGEEAMKPLVLHDIAETLSMHESTISRVTTRKYMYTPRGTFELKYFFSSHVATLLGGEASSTAIRAVIRKLIAAENVGKPFSDSKIASILLKQGINVARRTIAKYREGMQIPPSNERKQLA